MTDYRVNYLALALSFGALAFGMLGACGGGGPVPETGPSEAEAAAPIARDASSQTAPTIATNPDKNAYFGDLHIHTANSFDAFIFGTRTVPDDAYRFAKGETIAHDGGFDISLEGPPLDFLAVTDHGEYMGVIPAMANPLSKLNKTATAQSIFGKDATDPRAAFLAVGVTIVSGEEVEDIYDREHMDTVWSRTVEAAERHNDPGKFTTFAGYEFTAMRRLDLGETLAAANLHRNVIFKDGAPERLFTTLDSTNPEDLWAWMDSQRESGRDVLAIPHNSNASNGEMFAVESYLGEALSKDWADLRTRNEPLVEITQLKGTSETHPSLSPNDEYAGFEQYEYFIGSLERASVNIGDFVRPAYGRGLEIEAREGVNPYKFGLIGSSDTHVSAATLVEENHWGKFPIDGAGPTGRLSVPPNGGQDWGAELEAEQQDLRQFSAIQYASSGLAGVWAEANTREAIFEAMARKETFGTSGPRIRVRLFAGYDYSLDMLRAPDMVGQAYARGVPMGRALTGEEASPRFLAWAMQDALSAPLQRMQMVKVWYANGASKERIYDIACADGTAPDEATRRCADNQASVSLESCETSGRGATELKTLWSDPDYTPEQDAVYYIRVLENPTCRWSTWDAIRNGTPPNPNFPATLQERAWTSPVFVKGG